MIRLVIGLACATLWVACHSNVEAVKEAEKISLANAVKYIPDNREDLYQVHFRMDQSMMIASGETTNPSAKKSLLALLQNPAYTLVDSVRILPDNSIDKESWGLVRVSVCNIRTAPGDYAEMSTQAIMGTPVRLLKKSRSWVFVQTPDRYLGWVDDDAIYRTDSTGLDTWRKAKKIIYLPLTGTGIDPGTREAVTDLVAGNILKLEELTKDGYIASIADGRRLLIPAADAMDFDLWKNRSKPDEASIANCARSLMGRPYLWGGTSPKGVDCSGFVKTVYFLNGIILARDASLQFRHGAFSDPKDGYEKLKPCDLVFFGKKADGEHPAKATHVGLYLGNGDYINSSGMVKIDSFDPQHKNYSKKRADAWLGGRTILGSEGEKGIILIRDHPWY